MIKTLRYRFIAVSMLSVVIVLTVIIGSINVINYVNINTMADTRLEMIAENGGSFPDDPMHFQDKMSSNDNKPNSDTDNDNLNNNKSASNYGSNQNNDPKNKANSNNNENHDEKLKEPPFNESIIFRQKEYKRGISAESPFDTRYFTVSFLDDGTVASINTGKIAAISTDTASEYATTIFSKNKKCGFIDNYKYLKSTDGDSKILYIFLDCQRELTTFRDFLVASCGISLVALVVVFLLVFYFSKKVMKPVAESYEKQKRFITDASHEIKTPLTIIDANTEVMEMMEGENEWTQSTRKQVKRLASLTEKLVFLSRMDEETNYLEMIDFSLSDAVLDTAEPFLSVAQTKDKTLEINVDPDINFNGDEKNIRQLVSLLLDNAMKYSNDSGTIKIDLTTSGKNKVLKVWNTVDEIQTGKLDMLFDRFYRLDASHNSKTGGFGIGLSVAQAIVHAHKGTITAQSDDGRSIYFLITL